MSKFTNFLDELVLPLVFLVAARYLGLFFSQYWFSINFKFGEQTDIASLPFIHFAGPAGMFTANSYSWFAIGIVVSLYFGLVVFRSVCFHQDHLHPKNAWHLHNKNLKFLLINQKDALYQMAVWAVLSTSLVFFATIDVSSGVLDPFVYGILFGVTSVTVLTAVFYNISKRKSNT